MDKRTLRYWVAFNRVSGIGAARIHKLLNYYQGDLERAWHAPELELSELINNKSAVENLRKARANADLDADLEVVARLGAQIITLADPDYPKLLRQIAIPSPVLYYKGTLSEADERAIGIVGTRNPTEYGLQATRAFAVGLVKAGVTVVSGLARGVDTAAHKATIVMGGRTFALLGHGIETIYPRENEALAESITQHGALITEFPVGMRADAGNFPMRNRLISGLSLGVLVVEAGAKSGALGTARHALEQNREVFAVPGSIFSDESQGTNLLIQAGEAKLVTRVGDMLDEFALNSPLFQQQPQSNTRTGLPESVSYQFSATEGDTAPPPAPTQLELPADMDETQTAILRALSYDTPTYIDEICAATGLPVRQVTSTLSMLELAGYVQPSGVLRFLLSKR